MTLIKTRTPLQKTIYLVVAAGLLTLVLWLVLYTPVARWLVSE
jgi:hypothetical protein